VNSKAVNPGFCEKWKLPAYHLEDLRVPQVGNPCSYQNGEINSQKPLQISCEVSITKYLKQNDLLIKTISP